VSTTLNNQDTLTYDDGPDQLIGELHAWGIHYLVGGSPPVQAKAHLPAVELIKRLAQCEYPRVRDASISLFLLHPELADSIQKAYQIAEPAVAEQIAVLTLATLYLQRLWSFRLAMTFGSTPGFPEQRFAHLWQSRQLPHMGKRPYINIDPQKFADRYAIVRQQLQQLD
jgi:hypothetical protein